MKLIEKTKDQLVFAAEMDESTANAIRRYVGQISVIAVDELEISRNDSPLYDETIAHRVGLIPLNMKSLKAAEKGKLKLDVKREGTVYSGDMKGHPEPVYKSIPITTLDKGQELQFTATVRLGKGTEHAKFSPGLMFYRNSAEIIMDKEFLEEVRKALPDAEIKEKGNKITVSDKGKKEITDVCEGIANKKKKKAEIVSGKELIISLESFGQLDAKDIFNESVDALRKDLASVEKAVEKA
ncbi:MAG TPA: DNA-directed RNA polymerase subunit D [Candidatus Nanoarchaeia archaeon]|uniref:DNA-directed RNA polymerase subunit D n=1 Tax=uncultured archaeon Rifle_16ft_4_minimus_37913 TaxID=1665152 RepID=A0A0H4T6E9_9ARCH|nr:DNA-directed RNA polymerase subunit D [uncultured archaeon Rifle_16ft_4_minimus_37913]HKZ33950.1 DNA-directed RNA polymerase subunit D [Candidatus Nanoarchaeia archaeon]